MVREKSNFFVADAQIYPGHKKIFVDKMHWYAMIYIFCYCCLLVWLTNDLKPMARLSNWMKYGFADNGVKTLSCKLYNT